MDLPYDPVIPLLGIYPKNPKTLIQKNMCTPMFIAALFTIAKIWNQPKHPSVDEWVKHYGTFIPSATAWMDLENIMLSKISQ